MSEHSLREVRRALPVSHLEVTIHTAHPPYRPLRHRALEEWELCRTDGWGALRRVLERLESLETLSLAANQLSSLPPALFALKQLRTLDLSKNCLAEVQADIAGLDSLQAC